MNELAGVLNELAADAPVEKASWPDVLARSRRIRPQPRASRRLVLVLVAAITLLALAGTAVGVAVSLLTQQERFHASVPDDPKRLGPLVEITSGDNWALIGWRSEVGICLDFAIPGNSPFGCGFPVRGAKPSTDASGAGLPTHAVAGFFSGSNLVGGDGKATIFGVAAHDVAAVKIELRDSRVIDAPVYDAPPALKAEVRFFIVRLPPGELRDSRVESPVRAYSAYDSAGSLIERTGG
jgi:hypothetical protein